VHKSPLSCAASGEINQKGNFATHLELFSMKRDLGVHSGELAFSFFSLWDEQTATHIGAATHGSGRSCNLRKTLTLALVSPSVC